MQEINPSPAFSIRSAFHPVLKHLLPSLFVLAVLSAAAIRGEESQSLIRLDLFEGFRDGWRNAWKDQRLFPFQKHTVYKVETDAAGGTALRADSEDANLGLIRPYDGFLPERAVLSWQWKIAAPLAANRNERERSGDDFAARVFVVFETSVLPTRTRAINYVWSAHEPAGSVFPNPYSDRVGMIVLRCGETTPGGAWHREERDLFADYRQFFGREPEKLSAVALMVDTDNTGLAATAWFRDLELTITPAPADADS